MSIPSDITIIESYILKALNVVGWFWHHFSFIPWYLASGNFKKLKCGTLQAKSISGLPSGPYRNIESLSELKTGFAGCQTIDSLFKKTVLQYGDKNCMGTRELIAEEDEVQTNGRVFKKVILGEYQWLTYNQAYDHVKRISSGIKALGVKSKDYVLIFAETKTEWMLTAQACFLRNFSIVTIYTTLGDDAIAYGFNQVKSHIVFTDAVLLPKIKKILPQLKFLKTIIYFGDVKKSTLSDFPEDIRIFSLQQIEDLGAKLKNINEPVDSPKPDDVAVIMYTSGSTGVPKGVVLTHKNVTSCLEGALSCIPALTAQDKYIGYLPLAHILELLVECGVLSRGVPIGYSNALTLSDQSSKIKKGTKGDISVIKPTIMAAVPMIFDRIRTAVMDKIKSGPRTTYLLFHFAYQYKLKQVRKGYDTPLLNRLIFNKVKSILGGELRFMLCGGAPLSPETEEFLNICFCCPVGQGYGLTETCAAGTVCAEWDHSTGRVGRPLTCCELKLVDWEEGGYLTSDKPHPRGEIVIRGQNVASGYFENPEATAEVFKMEDGKWSFYTGDIGEVHPDGVFKIIDRKKDLIKLSHGEYVSLGKVESTIKNSSYIDNCCAYGDSQASYLVLLAVPNHTAIMELANQLSVSGSFEDVCRNKSVIDAIMKDINVLSIKNGLNKTEQPAKVKLCTENWLPENDLVTAAFKLKRKSIEKFYQRDIEMMYLN
ncbi:long-chain-fatty-acid--CoA ligase 4 isoform X1 [Hydra vulgaris]|uniref:long-chain-fatty-acid--CoA ligase n=2 Tax=Hydra vulgaris TaxID=6087 RepID=T2MIF0_HYDVU|nr:long-chain-fatty-acid--CoA ligase 4 isoform X1 [Hydra vulgaris]